MDTVHMTVDTPEQMHALGERIAMHLRAGDLVVLTGELGAGKTTLTRGIGRALAVRGAVTSPTFVIARTHAREGGQPPLVHVDAYRLSDARELDDLDIDFAGSIVIVEWGRGFVESLVEDRLDIDIERPTGATSQTSTLNDADLTDDSPEPRRVTIRGIGPRWAEVTW